MDAAIIGGSLVGLATVLALAGRGLPVTIFERLAVIRSHTEFRELAGDL